MVQPGMLLQKRQGLSRPGGSGLGCWLAKAAISRKAASMEPAMLTDADCRHFAGESAVERLISTARWRNQARASEPAQTAESLRTLAVSHTHTTQFSQFSNRMRGFPTTAAPNSQQI